MLQLKIKKLRSSAVVPKYQTEDAAGFDLHSAEEIPITLYSEERILIRTGLAFEIPIGMEGQIRTRSGIANKMGIQVLNSPGTVDSDYRGEVGVILINHSAHKQTINPGDRIAQMVICPVVKCALVEVESLSDTVRADKGFGSTGI